MGANPLPDGGTSFRVWAPRPKSVELRVLSPNQEAIPLTPDGAGYWTGVAEGIGPGARYLFRLDGDPARDRPDPASRLQPEGVHGPSQVVDASFPWTDGHWRGLPLARHVLYEIHVGTYTEEGTFEAIIPHLGHLADLGVTTLELMPVAQFPGLRNWGYDGAFPYAVQASYGGPAGLKRLVDAAHAKGLALILDVVYNHLGPEGNYLGEFGPYFTDCYKTPWGSALNFDAEDSDEVRRYFLDNAAAWIEDYHLDGLRLDATHFIKDSSAEHFLAALERRCRLAGEGQARAVHLFAESDANDAKWIQPTALGGFGLDAQWNDDWQHALFALLPGADAKSYARDYGRFDQLAKAFSDGFVYSGDYSPHRRRRHGNSSRGIPGERFVVFMQNHDQVGNRPAGDRLPCQKVSFEGLKLAAAALLLSPNLPLLFMGEEWGETAPFFYFVDHSDPDLIKAVRKGRAEEFASFLNGQEPVDPQDEATFQRSKVQHRLRGEPRHRDLWGWHRECLRLRREVPALADLDRSRRLEVVPFPAQRVLAIRRGEDSEQALLLLNVSSSLQAVNVSQRAGSRWSKALDSADAKWLGPGSPAPAQLTFGPEPSATRNERGDLDTLPLEIAPESATLYLLVDG